MMHGKKTVVVLIILFALVCSVSATGTGNQVTDEILIQDCNTRPEYAPPAYGDVCQGETDYHIYTPGNEQILEVSLKWDHTSGNDLDLYIKPPESDSIRFHDQDDGKIDGMISINIPLNSAIVNKLWNFNVFGSRVSGTQPYTLIINSY